MPLYSPATAKRKILKHLRGGITSMAAATAAGGISARTMFRWRKNDAEFGAALEEAKGDQAALRVAAVEETVTQQILEGKAPPALTIFFLKANSEKYRVADQYGVRHSGQVNLVAQRREADQELQAWEAKHAVDARRQGHGRRMLVKGGGGDGEDGPGDGD